MFPVFTVIFLLIPALEIFLLIEIGGVIGAAWTILLVILTAVIGVGLLKIQGLATLMRAQGKMQTGQMPAQEMLEGVGLIVAGAFLLTPGFFTDTVGFMLLIPPFRAWLVSKTMASIMRSGRFVLTPFGAETPSQPARHKTTKSGDVIEGVNYTRED